MGPLTSTTNGGVSASEQFRFMSDRETTISYHEYPMSSDTESSQNLMGTVAPTFTQTEPNSVTLSRTIAHNQMSTTRILPSENFNQIPSFTQRLKNLLSPKGYALFKKEMPVAPENGCENAHLPTPKNIKRQQNKHALHFKATKKWSLLLKKIRGYKKHNQCYIQRTSACNLGECPVKTRKVHRISISRAFCRIYAFKVGCKNVNMDLVNLDQPEILEKEPGLKNAYSEYSARLTKEQLEKFNPKLTEEVPTNGVEVPKFSTGVDKKHLQKCLHHDESKTLVAREDFHNKVGHKLERDLRVQMKDPRWNEFPTTSKQKKRKAEEENGQKKRVKVEVKEKEKESEVKEFKIAKFPVNTKLISSVEISSPKAEMFSEVSSEVSSEAESSKELNLYSPRKEFQEIKMTQSFSQVHSEIHGPKELWVALDLEPILKPRLNNSELICLNVDLRVCRNITEKKMDEYLTQWRLIMKTSMVPKAEVGDQKPNDLLQLKSSVQVQDDLMRQCEMKILGQFDLLDQFEEYVHALLDGLQDSGHALVVVCFHMAENEVSEINLDYYEDRLSTIMEDLEQMEDLDNSVKENILSMHASSKKSLTGYFQSHKSAYSFKQKLLEQYLEHHQKWVQDPSQKALTLLELNKNLGSENIRFQRVFSRELHNLNVYDVLGQKLDRLNTLHESVSTSREQLQLTFNEVASRFLAHIYESHGTRKRH